MQFKHAKASREHFYAKYCTTIGGESIHMGWGHKTMFDICRGHAETKPDSIAYVWISDRETIERSLTFSQLFSSAFLICCALRAKGLCNQRVLLLYRPSLDFIVGLLGCFAANVIAVPVAPGSARHNAERWAAIATDCAAKGILMDCRTANETRHLLADDPVLSALTLVIADLSDDETDAALVDSSLSSQNIAFIQYTSGSTGSAKGVLISHRNILANEEMIRMAFQHSDSTIFAGWLPFYHDMGLIGNVLQPLFLGVKSVLMSPETFIQKPLRWLRMISHFRATTSGAPNFAYDLCARRVAGESLANIDLSCWRVAFNGAEPVRADTVELFSRKFRACGFRSSAFYPCYGLAEATLFVSGGQPDTEPNIIEVDVGALRLNRVKRSSGCERQSVVGCGHAPPSVSIVIVDPGKCVPVAPDTVGEIWVKGPSVSDGYVNRPEAKSKIFDAWLGEEGPFLRTGDLGFISDEELFVTGRIKELLIINGLNYYPTDIERSLNGLHQAFRDGSAAAFAVETSHTIQIGLLQEVDRKFNSILVSQDLEALQEMQAMVRHVVADDHGLAIHGCMFVPHGSIPRTSSGKIRREECARIYLGGLSVRPGLVSGADT